jgi:hypothetical protein
LINLSKKDRKKKKKTERKSERETGNGQGERGGGKEKISDLRYHVEFDGKNKRWMKEQTMDTFSNRENHAVRLSFGVSDTQTTQNTSIHRSTPH